MLLTDFRKQYPQYDDLTDQQLAQGLHRQFYSDIPFDQFASQVGLGMATEGSLGQTDLARQAEEESPFRAIADVPVSIAQGAVQGVRFIADAFGADSDVSKSLRGAEDYLGSLMSAGARQDKEEIARIMKEAEDKGALDQVKAGLEAFTVAPVDMVTQALGTSAPIIAGTILATLTGGAPLALGTGVAMGTATGLGVGKGAIYDTVKEELVKAGVPEDFAEERAVAAQEYGGQNLDQILLAGGLGLVASRTGLEKSAIQSLVRNISSKVSAKELAQEATESLAQRGAISQIARTAAVEGGTEFLQGAQEQLAGNIAAQREGLDIDATRGVIGGGTLEALAGGLTGAAVESAVQLTGDRAQEQLDQEIEQIIQGKQQTAVTPEEEQLATETLLTEDEAEQERLRLAAQFEAQGMSFTEANKAATDALLERRAEREPELEQPDIGRGEPSVGALDAPIPTEEPATEPTGVEPTGVDRVSEPADAVSVGAEPVTSALTQRLDSLGIPKGAAIRRRLKGVDINTDEGFQRLQDELRAYAANPRVNEDVRTRVSEVLAAGDGAAAPLAAMEEQVAAAREPEPTPEVAPEAEPEIDEAAAEEGRRMIEQYEEARAQGATEAEASAVAQAAQEEELPPSLVERILEQLQSRREEIGEEEFAGEANRAYTKAVRLEDKFDRRALGRLQDRAQVLIAEGNDVISAYDQAEAELDAANAPTPEQAAEIQQTNKQNKALRNEVNALGKEIGLDTDLEYVFENELAAIPETERLQILKQTAQLAKDNDKYNFFLPTQSVQRAFQDPDIQNLVTTARQTAAAELEARRAGREMDPIEAGAERARAARRLAEAQAAKTAQREITREERRQLQKNELKQLNRDMQADFKVISTPLNVRAEIEAIEQSNRTRRSADQIPVPNENAVRAAHANRRREAIASALRLLMDDRVKRESVAARTANDIINHPTVSLEELSSAYNAIEQTDAQFLMRAMEYKYGDIITDAMRASRADAINEMAGTEVDQGILGASTLDAAMESIKKNGTPFQKILASRLAPFLRGVRLVVVNDVASDVRDPVARAEFVAGKQPVGLYFDNTIYLNNSSEFNGVNPTVLLHEALHGATLAKIVAYLNPETRTSMDAESRAAVESLNNVMLNAYKFYAIRNVAGKSTREEDALYQIGAFTDLKEFVAYGMTQPEMQNFLLTIPGDFKQGEIKGFLSRFVDSVRKLFKIPQNQSTALADLIEATDRVLSANDVELSPSARAAMAQKIKRQDEMMRKLELSNRGTEFNKSLGQLFMSARNFNDFKNFFRALFDAMDAGRLGIILPAITTDQMVELVGDDVKNLKIVNRLTADMAGKRTQMIRDLALKVPQWAEFNRKSEEGGKLLGDVMHFATLRDVDPSAFPDVATALVQDPELKRLRAVYANKNTPKNEKTQAGKAIGTREAAIKEIYPMWQKLGTFQNGMGHKLYKMAKESYEQTFETHIQLLKDKINRASIDDEAKNQLLAKITASYQEAKKLGVYFPLMRYGNYWVRVGKPRSKDGEFYMFETATARNLFLRQRFQELKDAGEQRSLTVMQEDGDIDLGDDLRDIRSDFLNTLNEDGSPSMLRQIFDMLDQNQLTDLDALKDQVYQLYLMTLPDADIRKKWIKRQGKTGFSADVLRNFITSQHTAANQLSRLEYSDKLRTALGAAYDEIQGDPNSVKLRRYIDEMSMRVDETLQPTPVDEMGLNKVATVGNQLVFYYMLTAPKSALVQMTQLPIVGLPVLTARYGAAKTAAITARYSNLFNTFGTTKKDAAGNIITRWGAPTIRDSKYAATKPHLKRAYEEAENRDMFMSTYAADMSARGKVATSQYEGTVSRATRFTLDFMGGAFHHLERVSREIMYMSTFELEYDKLLAQGVNADQAFDRAVDTATDIVYESLFNYTQFNKPRFMKQPIARLGTQFLTYPMQMTWFLTKNFFKSLPFLNKTEKKEAATKFFGAMGMTFMFGGATSLGMGLIGYSSIMGLMEGLREAFRPDMEDDDADEYYDEDDDGNPLGKRSLDLWFRNWFLPHYFGPDSDLAKMLGMTPEQAELLQRSVELGPISAVTDLNIGASTSLDGLWFRDDLKSDNYQGAFQELLFNYALGPFGSMGTQVASALDDWNTGQVNRAVEKLLPAFFRGSAKAMRIADEGELTRQNVEIMSAEWYTTGKLIGLAGGFQSTEVAEIQKANFTAKRLVTGLEKERTKLLSDLDRAIQLFDNNPTEDNEVGVDEVMQNIEEFNYKNGFFAIDSETIRKSLLGRAERRAEAYQGLVVSPRLAPFIYPLVESSRSPEVR